MTSPQADAFVPLSGGPANAGASSDFKVLLLDKPERAHPFHSAEDSAFGAAPAPAKPSCEPRVSLQRDGDKIIGIHIQCSCGQLIDLACVYPAEKAE
jgi:hypothetical protein